MSNDLADRASWLFDKVGKLPPHVREYRFHPARKWRFDIAWPAIKLAVEIHGGEFVRGQHVRGAGLARDLEKSRAAQLAGWMVLAYTGCDLSRRSSLMIDEVRFAIGSWPVVG